MEQRDGRTLTPLQLDELRSRAVCLWQEGQEPQLDTSTRERNPEADHRQDPRPTQISVQILCYIV